MVSSFQKSVAPSMFIPVGNVEQTIQDMLRKFTSTEDYDGARHTMLAYIKYKYPEMKIYDIVEVKINNTLVIVKFVE